MTEGIMVISKISAGVVLLTYQQILTIVSYLHKKMEKLITPILSLFLYLYKLFAQSA